MSDIVDAASAAIEICQLEAEQRARGHSAPEEHPDFDGLTCVECGEEIPTARLALGRVRCVGCQELIEHKARVGH